MSFRIPSEELRRIVSLGVQITISIKKPEPNGIYSIKEPLFSELQAMIFMLFSQAEQAFKLKAFEKRMSVLTNLIKEHASPCELTDVTKFKLLMIEKLGKLYLEKNDLSLIQIQLAAELRIAQSLLNSIPLKHALKVPVRSQKKMHQLIAGLWSMIAALHSEINGDVAKQFIIKSHNFSKALIYDQCIPWVTLELVSTLRARVFIQLKNYEKSVENTSKTTNTRKIFRIPLKKNILDDEAGLKEVILRSPKSLSSKKAVEWVPCAVPSPASNGEEIPLNPLCEIINTESSEDALAMIEKNKKRRSTL